MQLQSGTLLQGGKYKIERVLGQGGFGITYLAVQELFDRHVCIKEFFFNDYCERGAQGEVTSCTINSKELVDRFLNKFIKEARTISRLDHPNIVRILDIFQENGTAYYAMEYIEGCSLADKVNEQGALSEAVAVGYIKQVASALDYIHQRSINHLDVKPANIMVRQSDNKAILIDFGLSKQYDEQGGQTSTTPVGISHGYAPMEQYNQGGVSTFSPQTDIYSLGATLYKLLTGNTPPQAIEIFNEGLTGFPQSLSPNLVAAIKKTMQPKKGDRPQSIGEFTALLGGQFAAIPNSSISPSHSDESTRIIGTTNSKPAKNISSPQPTVTFVDESKKTSGSNKLGYIIVACIVAFALLFGLYNKGGDTVGTGNSPTAQELFQRAMEYWYADDFVNAGPLFEMAVEKGHEESKVFLGVCYIKANVDVPRGLNILTDLAKQENVDAQLQLGAIYKYGVNVEKNEKEGFYWWNKAAQHGGAFSQYLVAMCYYNGEGVKKDLQAAKRLLEKSAEQGYEEAKTALVSLKEEEKKNEQARLAEVRRQEREAAAKAEEERKAAEYRRTHGSINGHEYVDLGLSVKWATCNVGASSPSDYGYYYAWGETSSKNTYTSSNSLTEYKNINDISGNYQYDAARKIWGGSWRLPTKTEVEELLDRCTWAWTTKDGMTGCTFTGPNGNSIFLPTAGNRVGTSLTSNGEIGFYWTSTPFDDATDDFAYYLVFNRTSGSPNIVKFDRMSGRSIRPVTY